MRLSRPALGLHLAAFALIVLMLAAFRAAFLLAWADPGLWGRAWGAFGWGLLLDARVAAIALAPSFLLGWLVPVRAQRAWLALAATLVFAIALVNHFYYRNFQSPLDAQAFLVADPENLRPVLATIARDYPWLRGLLAIAAVFWLVRRLLARVPEPRWRGRAHAAGWAALLALFVLAARGSVGVFPLTPNRIPSQGAHVLDAALVNGPMALAMGWDDYRRNARLPEVSEEAARRAWRLLYGAPMPERPWMRASVPHAPKDAPLPNIVVFQMESMGAGVLALDGVAGNDLLGRLRAHWREAFVWPAAASAGLGTDVTLGRMVAGAFAEHYIYGAFRRTPLAGAWPAALRRLGYRTVFVTGGVKTWAHLDEFLPAQGFDEVVGMADIKKALPGARSDGTWGLYDEYLFAYVRKRLAAARRPLLIYAMTITNHSPYRLPPEARAVRFTIPERFRPLFLRPEEAPQALAAYRYAADRLGRFVDAWKGEPWGARTIVAATGDHYMRDALNYHRRAEDSAHQYLVPMLLWVPAAYRRDARHDAAAPASHWDLVPTILARLPVPVLAFQPGRDLLAPEPPGAFALGQGFAMDRAGCVIGRARFRWRKGIGGPVAPAPKDPALARLAARKEAMETLLGWTTRQRALAWKDRAP